MRIHLKPGKDRYMMKIDGQDKMVGREVVAVFKKAKTHNALGNGSLRFLPCRHGRRVPLRRGRGQGRNRRCENRQGV
jgi:hypothetical protein